MRESEIVLQKLAQVVDAKGRRLFEACVEAVAAGATLGEMTRAMRIHDSPCEPITPVCITRAAVGIRAAARGHGSPTRPAPVSARRCSCATWGRCASTRRALISRRGFFAAGGYEVVSPEGFKTPADAAKAFGESEGADRGDLFDGRKISRRWCRRWPRRSRDQKADALIVLAGYPQDQIEAHKTAGVDEFIHVRADAVRIAVRISLQARN